mgnify:CR=1 FL=1
MFVSLLIMRTMLQPEGAVNVLLRNIGLIASDASLPFFTDATWARVTVIIINVWVGVPYTLLQLTGVLQNIPEDFMKPQKWMEQMIPDIYKDYVAIYVVCDNTVSDRNLYGKCQ